MTRHLDSRAFTFTVLISLSFGCVALIANGIHLHDWGTGFGLVLLTTMAVLGVGLLNPPSALHRESIAKPKRLRAA